MARIDWVETRLLNWARWKAGGGSFSGDYAKVNWGAEGVRGRYAEVQIPTNAIEAGDTDAAVQALPGELRATVTEFYVGEGGEAQHLQQLQCTRSTMHARIERAHRLLAERWNTQRAARDAERSRVESLRREGGR